MNATASSLPASFACSSNSTSLILLLPTWVLQQALQVLPIRLAPLPGKIVNAFPRCYISKELSSSIVLPQKDRLATFMVRPHASPLPENLAAAESKYCPSNGPGFYCRKIGDMEPQLRYATIRQDPLESWYSQTSLPPEAARDLWWDLAAKARGTYSTALGSDQVYSTTKQFFSLLSPQDTDVDS